MPGFYATIARFYDAENTDKNDDIGFYLGLAEEHGVSGGPILDVGCGTGRVMFPLAQAGYEMHGIDNEQAMLERARERLAGVSKETAKRLHFHHGDVLSYAMPIKFALTLVPYNGLMHFREQEQQIALLKQLRQWTRDDGLLVLDLPNAGDVFGTQDSESMVFERTFLEPETGHMVMQQSLSLLDRTTQQLKVTWIYDEITEDGTVKRTFASLMLYYYFFNELNLLLKHTGFEVVDVYGDLEGGPYEDGAPRMVVIARPV
jgi:SAM-dependent methyltransferase